MKINSLNLFPVFAGRKYQNSKYMLKYSRNSILDSAATKKETPPDTLDLSDDKAVYEYSSDRVKSLFDFFIIKKESFDRMTKTILSKLENGSVDSSNLGMVMDLIEDKKLSPSVLFSINGENKIGRKAEEDLDKLYDAYINKKDVSKVFVPDFESREEAEANIDIGDVCQIAGDKNISVKTETGEIEEIFMSKETYLELFPPVERFALSQSNLGNCYFVAAIDSMYQNKNARHKILKMFKENEDGTVDAAFCGFEKRNGKTVLKDSDSYVLKDVESAINDTYLNYMAYTSEGLRALEILNERSASHMASLDIQEQYDDFKKLRDEAEKSGFAFYKGFKYTKEEIEMFLEFADKNGKSKLISSKRKDNPDLCLDMEDVLYSTNLLEEEGKSDFCSKYEGCILERYKEYLERTGEDYVIFKEIIPIELYAEIFGQDVDSYSYSAYNYSGCSTAIFKKAGLDVFSADIHSSEAKEILNSKMADKCVFSACTNDTAENKYGIVPHHAYSVEPFDTKEGRMFAVRNPKGALCENILDFNELLKYFSFIEAGMVVD